MKKVLFLIVALIGGIIGAALSNAAFKSMFRRGDSASFDRQLVETSKKINAILPMQIDTVTRLDATGAGPGNRFTLFTHR